MLKPFVDVFSKPTISFLEHRIAERGILIQLLPEKVDELVDAIIEFTNDKSTSGQGEHFENYLKIFNVLYILYINN